jgi:hypothetical protein
MRDPRIAIIGAGMAGVLSAIKLEEAGLTDFTVYEKASRLGGTWRENTYPGLGCDVPSHLYSYSFALNPGWSHRYSPGAEIQAYLSAPRGGGVLPHSALATVVRSTFESGRWRIETRAAPRGGRHHHRGHGRAPPRKIPAGGDRPSRAPPSTARALIQVPLDGGAFADRHGLDRGGDGALVAAWRSSRCSSAPRSG